MSDNSSKQKDFFLPDFCQTQSVFMVVLTAELLAVLFTLIDTKSETFAWDALGLYSLSIQIVTLFSVAGLCLLRPFLSKFNDVVAGLLSLLVILLTSLLFTLGLIKWFLVSDINFTNPAQFHIIMRNIFVSGMIGSVLLRYFYLQQQYRRRLVSEASARLDALQARIRPHFLFNSMNVIASLTRIDPAKAESAIEDLCDLFRATLDNKQELIVFSDELKNTECYLAIEKLRLGKRLEIHKNIDPEVMSVLVPPLSLQPLLENAVYHGIQMLPDGGTITINAKLANDTLVIHVINPKVQQTNTKGHGIALRNIIQRLEVIYAGKASLSRKSDDQRNCVEMTVPLSKVI